MGSNARLMTGSSARKKGASNRYYGDNGLTQLREACGLVAITPGKVSCLKCQRDFNSPDKTRIRICFGCKGDSVWSGSRESDALYPAIPKNMGYNPSRSQGDSESREGSLVPKKKSRLGIKSAAKKRSLSRNQKHFGKEPLAKKRTRA